MGVKVGDVSAGGGAASDKANSGMVAGLFIEFL
jgi:hypothetical protein